MRSKLYLFSFLIFIGCYEGQRNCKNFKTGTFESTITVNGVSEKTLSKRSDSLVIETYKGKTDTATIRWVNDCEYILRKQNPKSMAEEKAIAIKILTTSQKTYTFEFGVVGSEQRQKGTAVRIK